MQKIPAQNIHLLQKGYGILQHPSPEEDTEKPIYVFKKLKSQKGMEIKIKDFNFSALKQ